MAFLSTLILALFFQTIREIYDLRRHPLNSPTIWYSDRFLLPSRCNSLDPPVHQAFSCFRVYVYLFVFLFSRFESLKRSAIIGLRFCPLFISMQLSSLTCLVSQVPLRVHYFSRRRSAEGDFGSTTTPRSSTIVFRGYEKSDSAIYWELDYTLV